MSRAIPLPRIRVEGRAPGVDLVTLSAGAVIGEEGVVFPGARPPDRRRTVRVDGVGLAVYEWGRPSARPIVLVHGGFDFARTFDVFAPLLADAGFRVVTWDHRNHGDSDSAELVSMYADVRDALAVVDSTSDDPMAIVGHSKGGGMVLRLADAVPHRFTHVVNIDGMPASLRHLDVADHERGRVRPADLAAWLDHRRAPARDRKPGTLQELARRRARSNPRLTHEWLCYLVTVGARRDLDGWRWKIDPTLRFGGFGPYRPDLMLDGMVGLSIPFLGIIGGQREAFAWASTAAEVEPFLPRRGRLEVFPSAGHFIHIEQPGEVAALVLDLLG